MTEFFGIPPATYEQLDADHIAAQRADQLNDAMYAQALTDPEACERYRHDLGFRMEIDLWLQAMLTADRIMAEEGASPELRNRIMHGMTFAREPYRGVDVDLGQPKPIRLPHGPFSITVEPAALVDGRFVQQALVAHCACGWAQRWEGGVSGGELLAWLSDHPLQRELHKAAKQVSPESLFGASRKDRSGG